MIRRRPLALATPVAGLLVMRFLAMAVAVTTGAAMGCAPPPQPSPPRQSTDMGRGARSAADAVHVWGSLRSVMHEGNTDARVELSNTVPGPHAYAVGALSGLRGEVTILDDEVILSFADPRGTPRTTIGAGQESATLLVRAVVPRWTSVSIDHAIGREKVDEQLEALASATGVDTKTRIPVLIEGTAKALEWHVLAGKGEGGPHAHHHAPRSTGRLSAVKVILVGFLSRSDEGVFTHMGEHGHFHVITSADRMTGHVDGFELEPGAVAHFPAP